MWGHNMGNKQSYNLDVVFAKFKCITDFFSNNAGSGENCITHSWMLILTAGICGATAKDFDIKNFPQIITKQCIFV